MTSGVAKEALPHSTKALNQLLQGSQRLQVMHTGQPGHVHEERRPDVTSQEPVGGS